MSHIQCVTVDGNRNSGEKTTVWMYKIFVNNGRNYQPKTGERRISSIESLHGSRWCFHGIPAYVISKDALKAADNKEFTMINTTVIYKVGPYQL